MNNGAPKAEPQEPDSIRFLLGNAQSIASALKKSNVEKLMELDHSIQLLFNRDKSRSAGAVVHFDGEPFLVARLADLGDADNGIKALNLFAVADNASLEWQLVESYNNLDSFALDTDSPVAKEQSLTGLAAALQHYTQENRIELAVGVDQLRKQIGDWNAEPKEAERVLNALLPEIRKFAPELSKKELTQTQSPVTNPSLAEIVRRSSKAQEYAKQAALVTALSPELRAALADAKAIELLQALVTADPSVKEKISGILSQRSRLDAARSFVASIAQAISPRLGERLQQNNSNRVSL